MAKKTTKVTAAKTNMEVSSSENTSQVAETTKATEEVTPTVLTAEELEKLNPLRPGNKIFMRTISLYYLGEVVGVIMNPVPVVLLKKASWVANTGIFGDFLKEGPTKATVLMIYPDPDKVVAVALSPMSDYVTWEHPLPDKNFPE